jgi:hypothetical protein
MRLLRSRTALTSIIVPFRRLLLHGDVLCRSPVARLGVHPQFLVKKGQLFVKLAPRLCDLFEPRPPLGVRDAVVRSRLRFGVARC